MTQTHNITVVRLRTSAWKDANGFHFQKTLRPLKRMCEGFQVLEDDCDQIGSLECINRIENLMDVPDGIYQIITINESRDWESGNIEEWDYKLVPHEPTQQQ